MATKRKNKKARGRPSTLKMPPRIDATAEEIAQAVLAVKVEPGHQWDYLKVPGGTVYYCTDCEREVAYPETLYRDGRCESCHDKALNQSQGGNYMESGIKTGLRVSEEFLGGFSFMYFSPWC